jgi:hypothetical protein
MEVNCEGCAGCCLDWRALAADLDHERRGPCEPIGDEYNLVALTRDEVRVFLDAGLGDALRPRLWHDGEREEGDGTADADGEADTGVRIDGRAARRPGGARPRRSGHPGLVAV